jgi:sugar phosphate isomerase/epimerase
VADALGGRHVSAGEFRPGSLDLDTAAPRLAGLADRLARRGLRVALEAFPWSALPDVGTAVDLVRRSGSADAGLMVDVWHFFNGGASVDLLDDLPGAGVVAVQLNDGPRVQADFLRHARAARRLPGEGDLDVVGLVRAVRDTGFAGPWCVEVNTPEFRSLPVDVAAKAAAEAARAVLGAAGG